MSEEPFFCFHVYSGNVSYIPGLSKTNRFLEYDNIKRWAITSDRGNVFVIGYYPDQCQPRKGIRFVSRQEGYIGILPDAILEDEPEEEEEPNAK